MKQGLLSCLLIIGTLFSYQVYAKGIEPMGGYDVKSFNLLRRLLSENSNTSFEDQDFIRYQNKIDRFKNKKTVSFGQKDAILHTFLNLSETLRKSLFSSTKPGWADVKILVERKAPLTLVRVSKSQGVPESVRLAAKISIYGTTHTPAIISDAFVNHIAGKSSAYSTMDAPKSIIYEAYRPATHTSLIISHEGFHSAMRRLGNLNRLNRLSQYIKVPVATGAEYSADLTQAINDLEKLSASHLESLSIDERFTSDHHGTIMGVIHHGIYQAMLDGVVDDGELSTFDTDYPFNYIAKEKHWSHEQKKKAQYRLAELNQKFIEDSQTLGLALNKIEESLVMFP